MVKPCASVDQMPSAQRRFPTPWSVEEFDACFVVQDGTGQKLAFVYFENEPRRRSAAKLLSKDKARIAARTSGQASWGVIRTYLKIV